MLQHIFLASIILIDFRCATGVASVESKRQQFEKFLNKDAQDAHRARTKQTNQDELVQWRNIIEPLLEVRCTYDNMTVKLHYESRQDNSKNTALENSVMFVGHDFNARCLARNDVEIGELVLSFNYDNCGVERSQTAFDNSFLFSATVTVDVGNTSTNPILRDVRETYQISCLQVKQTEKNEDVHNLKLLGQKYDGDPWTFPKDVEMGSQVFANGEIQLPEKYINHNVRSFPLNCWVAQSAGVIDEQYRRNFLLDGCPVNDHRGRGLSRVHRFSDGQVKVSFSIVSSLLWPEAQQQVFVHCQLLSCVQSNVHGIIGVPECPISSYCAGNPQTSHSLPPNLHDVKLHNVVAGPLNVVEKKDTSVVIDSPMVDMDLKCQMACAQTAIPLPNKTAQQSTLYVEGVSTKMVVAIAFASFLIGMLMMAVLWFVHVRTDPKRKAAKLHAASSNVSSNNNNVNMRLYSHTSVTNGHALNERNCPATTKLMLNSL